MNIEDLLLSTQPIIFEELDETEPYDYSGTCYPVKYKGSLFIVSAYHCYKTCNIEPEGTLFPLPSDPQEFFAFDRTYRFRVPTSNDEEHYDHVCLRVAGTSLSDSKFDKVNALDLAIQSNAKLPTSNEIKDFWIRGFPHDAPKHRIDYEQKTISKQAYCTNGVLHVKKAPSDFCYIIGMKTPIPSGMHPNGISGSPVYGITFANQPVYCGTIIKYSEGSGEYFVIGPEIIVNGLNSLETD